MKLDEWLGNHGPAVSLYYNGNCMLVCSPGRVKGAVSLYYDGNCMLVYSAGLKVLCPCTTMVIACHVVVCSLFRIRVTNTVQ